MSTFYIKQNDTAPSIAALLKNPSGSAINLTGATVRFNMKSQSGTLLVDNATAVVVDESTGNVRYDWALGDTALAGNNYAEFEITYSDGGVETVPNDGYIRVKITPEVG